MNNCLPQSRLCYFQQIDRLYYSYILISNADLRYLFKQEMVDTV